MDSKVTALGPERNDTTLTPSRTNTRPSDDTGDDKTKTLATHTRTHTHKENITEERGTSYNQREQNKWEEKKQQQHEKKTLKKKKQNKKKQIQKRR